MAGEYLTKQGYERLHAQKDALERRLLEAGEKAGAAAGSSCDWHDNPAYDYAVEEMRILGSQIADIARRLKSAIVIDPRVTGDCVAIGTRLIVDIDGERETYLIAGANDSDPAHGVISYKAPLAQALLGHRIGDDVVVRAPTGQYCVRILGIAVEEGDMDS